MRPLSFDKQTILYGRTHKLTFSSCQINLKICKIQKKKNYIFGHSIVMVLFSPPIAVLPLILVEDHLHILRSLKVISSSPNDHMDLIHEFVAPFHAMAPEKVIAKIKICYDG